MQGLIFLDPKSSILFEQLKERIIEYESYIYVNIEKSIFSLSYIYCNQFRGKREPCEISFSDFDGEDTLRTK